SEISPSSPRVSESRPTSTPASAHAASVPPARSDSSSGWANTARTPPAVMSPALRDAPPCPRTGPHIRPPCARSRSAQPRARAREQAVALLGADPAGVADPFAVHERLDRIREVLAGGAGQHDRQARLLGDADGVHRSLVGDHAPEEEQVVAGVGREGEGVDVD